MKTKNLFALAIASAFCTWLSTAPIGSAIAAVLGPALLIYIALHASTTRRACIVIFSTQFPLWLVLHSWISEVTFLGWLALALYMSLWAPLFVFLLRKTKNIPISVVITAPVLWVALECLRGIVIFDGYPWYLAGTGAVESPLANIAMYGSVWAVSFLVVTIAAVVATFRSQRWYTIAGVALVSFYVVAVPYGNHLLNAQQSFTTVLVIQTNVSQSNKVAWTWEQQRQDIFGAIDQTREAISNASEKPSLVVWPETMVPGSGFEVSRFEFAPWDEQFTPFWFWSSQIRALAQELDIPILVGSQTWVDITVIEDTEFLRVDPKEQFNSAVLVYPDGSTERYDKSFLTPFGERIPYVEDFSSLKNWVRDMFGTAMLFDLQAGGTTHRFAIPSTRVRNADATLTFATPICFEDTVPSVVRNLVWKNGERKAGALINLSNDGWFGSDASAHAQHVREAQMRCIENMTPMVRVANTGVSCFINYHGQVEDSLPILESGSLFVQLHSGEQLPLSRFIGDAVAWVCLFVGILLVLGSCFKRSKKQ